VLKYANNIYIRINDADTIGENICRFFANEAPNSRVNRIANMIILLIKVLSKYPSKVVENKITYITPSPKLINAAINYANIEIGFVAP
jgi:hypothetical protein